MYNIFVARCNHVVIPLYILYFLCTKYSTNTCNNFLNLGKVELFTLFNVQANVHFFYIFSFLRFENLLNMFDTNVLVIFFFTNWTFRSYIFCTVIAHTQMATWNKKMRRNTTFTNVTISMYVLR